MGLNWRISAIVISTKNEAHAESLRKQINSLRRDGSLNAQQRRQLAQDLLISNQLQSDESIAAISGFERSTICRLRNQLVKTHKLAPKLKTLGVDGKEQAVSSGKRRFAQKTKFFIPRFSNEKAMAEFCDQVESVGGKTKTTSAFVLQKKLKREIHHEINLNLKRAALDRYKQLPPDESIQHCEFKDLDIANHTADLVLTDPLWHTDQLQCWLDLSVCAERWLKADGLLAVYFGSSYYPELLRALHPIWGDPKATLIIYQPRSNSHVRSCFMISRHKFVFVFSRKTDFCFVDHALPSVYVDSGPEKEWHEYQQTVGCFEWLLTHLSKIDDFVIDPHLGSGTTAIACANMSRRFIGCDRDLAAVAVARKRLDELTDEVKESA